MDQDGKQKEDIELLTILESHRKYIEIGFQDDIMLSIQDMTNAIDVEISRQCGRLIHRSNYQSKTSLQEYYHIAIFIACLDYVMK